MSEDPNQPATKRDLAELEARLTSAIDTKLDDLKTELLTAFYGYTENVQERLQERDRLRERMANIENRILKVEKRLDLGKASA